MEKLEVGINYIPLNELNYEEKYLEGIPDEIRKEKVFVVKPPIFDYGLVFESKDKKTHIKVYSNGKVEYKKAALEKKDFTPVQLKSLTKKGLDFAQNYTPTKKYAKRIKLSVTGDDDMMYYFYNSKARSVINDFAKDLFGKGVVLGNPIIGDYGFEISVESAEVPVLEIPD